LPIYVAVDFGSISNIPRRSRWCQFLGDLTHADLTGANVAGADFTGADLDGTIMRVEGLKEVKGLEHARNWDKAVR
jgi:hypothetical protein